MEAEWWVPFSVPSYEWPSCGGNAKLKAAELSEKTSVSAVDPGRKDRQLLLPQEPKGTRGGTRGWGPSSPQRQVFIYPLC